MRALAARLCGTPRAIAAQSDIRRKALALLGRREHTWNDLEYKLRRRGFAPAAIEQVLHALRAEDLLSSKRYIEDYVHYCIRRYRGPKRIRIELENKGLATEEIVQALHAAAADWLGIARRCYAKKYGGRGAPDDSAERMRRSQYLYRQGFPREIIRQVVE